MRIIAGSLGGRAIRSVPGSAARPAMARVRESLFSMLEARGINWDGLAVLDLFAGTGSLAYEALSRGAARAVMVENSAPLCRMLARNNDELGLAGRAYVARRDAGRHLRQEPPSPYGLVFLDPPYRRGLAAGALAALTSRGWLAPGAFVAAELETGLAFAAPPELKPAANRLFGQTHLHVWKYENSPLSGDF